ncbi:hypothetical protein ACFL35_04720 [Candidatus Riflebacteria bacterium]
MKNKKNVANAQKLPIIQKEEKIKIRKGEFKMQKTEKIIEGVFEKTEGIVFKGYKDLVKIGLKNHKEMTGMLQKQLEQAEETFQIAWNMNTTLLDELEKNIKIVSKNSFENLENVMKPWSHN